MSEELYRQVQGSYIIDRSVVECMKNNSIIMHCLPRVGEIETSVDNNIRAVYLSRQVRNGLYLRMALLNLILGKI
ncbi:hypothetical protein FJY90_07995 [Candidatus Gottesmanbacteria bacterium]|nr:hypothetical protein [Candidatus Gottesmanbacteria bacterium]